MKYETSINKPLYIYVNESGDIQILDEDWNNFKKKASNIGKRAAITGMAALTLYGSGLKPNVKPIEQPKRQVSISQQQDNKAKTPKEVLDKFASDSTEALSWTDFGDIKNSKINKNLDNSKIYTTTGGKQYDSFRK